MEQSDAEGHGEDRFKEVPCSCWICSVAMNRCCETLSHMGQVSQGTRVHGKGVRERLAWMSRTLQVTCFRRPTDGVHLCGVSRHQARYGLNPGWMVNPDSAQRPRNNDLRSSSQAPNTREAPKGNSNARLRGSTAALELEAGLSWCLELDCSSMAPSSRPLTPGPCPRESVTRRNSAAARRRPASRCNSVTGHPGARGDGDAAGRRSTCRWCGLPGTAAAFKS
jgi:hypothetical protein